MQAVIPSAHWCQRAPQKHFQLAEEASVFGLVRDHEAHRSALPPSARTNRELKENMETSPVAWYAAILSSLVFVWDFAKWWRAEPRLRVTARADVGFVDGEVVSVDEHADGTTITTMATYCLVEIVNVGGRPTTLISVDAFSHRKRPRQVEIGIHGAVFTVLRGSEALPAKLGPGEMWSARVDMRRLESLQQIGSPRIRARASWPDRPFVTTVYQPRKRS